MQAGILAQIELAGPQAIKNVICDLSASPSIDLAGAHMLADGDDLGGRGIALTATNAHGQVRDLLRAEGLDGKIHGIARGISLEVELQPWSVAGKPTR